jgi:hypothetical protein
MVFAGAASGTRRSVRERSNLSGMKLFRVSENWLRLLDLDPEADVFASMPYPSTEIAKNSAISKTRSRSRVTDFFRAFIDQRRFIDE